MCVRLSLRQSMYRSVARDKSLLRVFIQIIISVSAIPSQRPRTLCLPAFLRFAGLYLPSPELTVIRPGGCIIGKLNISKANRLEATLRHGRAGHRSSRRIDASVLGLFIRVSHHSITAASLFNRVCSKQPRSIIPAIAEASPSKPGPKDTIVWRFNDDPIPKVSQTGRCHCGTVRFRVQHEALTRQPGYHISVKMCDCSICGLNGYLLIHLEHHEIEWLSGENILVDYRFATENKAHKFCGQCSSSICLDSLGSWMSWAGDVVGSNLSTHRLSLRNHIQLPLYKIQDVLSTNKLIAIGPHAR